MKTFAFSHLTDLLWSNPRYAFTCDFPVRRRKVPRHTARRMTYRWVHKRYGGEIKLKKQDNTSWAEIVAENEGQLVGALVYRKRNSDGSGYNEEVHG